MLMQYCSNLLSGGNGSIADYRFDSMEQIELKLKSGITVKKLHSLHTALLLIEMIKVQQPDVSQAQQFQLFDNFVTFIFDKFPQPTAMAVLKYAISDRKLVIRKMAESSSWSRISEVFKPIMLDNSQEPLEKTKYKKFERMYACLKNCAEISNLMKKYAASYQMIDFQ